MRDVNAWTCKHHQEEGEGVIEVEPDSAKRQLAGEHISEEQAEDCGGCNFRSPFKPGECLIGSPGIVSGAPLERVLAPPVTPETALYK